MTEVRYPAGHVFRDPDSEQAYRLRRMITTRDDEPLSHRDFEPLGGAPEPKRGELLPRWLERQIREAWR